jgi:hypothetical protein
MQRLIQHEFSCAEVWSVKKSGGRVCRGEGLCEILRHERLSTQLKLKMVKYGEYTFLGNVGCILELVEVKNQRFVRRNREVFGSIHMIKV